MWRHYQHKNDENIIIKEADKGSAVVIMKCEYYKSLCLTVLENDKYYEKQQAYESMEVLKELSAIID